MPSEHNDEYLLNLSLPCVRDFGDMVLVLRGVNSFLLSASSALTITCSAMGELNGLHLIPHAHVKLPGFAANVAQNNLPISVEPCLWYHHFSTACTDITAQQSLHCVMLTWLASPTLAWPFAGYSFTFFGIITKLNSFS